MGKDIRQAFVRLYTAVRRSKALPPCLISDRSHGNRTPQFEAENFGVYWVCTQIFPHPWDRDMIVVLTSTQCGLRGRIGYTLLYSMDFRGAADFRRSGLRRSGSRDRRSLGLHSLVQQDF